MHFDTNLDEEANDLEAIAGGMAAQYDLSAPGKGAALCLNNTDVASRNWLIIPHRDLLSLRSSFTIDFWFKINSWESGSNDKPAIISKPVAGNRANYCLIGNSSRGSVIFNARKERIDEQTGAYPEEAGLVISTSDLLIGKGSGSTNSFDGCIDELRISRIIRDFDAVWSGIEENAIEVVSFSVYPNPASDIIKIHIVNPDLEINNISIISIDGKLAAEIVMPKPVGYDPDIRINTSNLKPGIYVLLVDTNLGRETKKIVIQ